MVGVGVELLGMEMGFWVGLPRVERRVLVLSLVMGGRIMGTVVTPALPVAMGVGTGLEVDMGSQVGRGIDM
jgi:hypothetical protein